MFVKAINESSLPELGLTHVLGKELPAEQEEKAE